MRKITILIVLIVLAVLLIANFPLSAVGPPPGWNKDLGNIYFRENTSNNAELVTSKSGTTADVFYHTAYWRDNRPSHTQWKLYDYVAPNAPGVSYGAEYTILAHWISEEDRPLVYIGAQYHVVGIHTMSTKTWTSGQIVKTKTTAITVSQGQALDWDCALSADYDEYRGSTVELDFSDNDYELVDFPDAGDTTRVETEHDHIVDLTMNSENDILFVTIVALSFDTTCDISVSLA